MLSLSADPDRLDVYELVDAETGQLPSGNLKGSGNLKVSTIYK
jgi:hypothetical protein